VRAVTAWSTAPYSTAPFATICAVEPRAIVVGGGVSGLTCALELAALGLRVEVRARELAQGTTSAVAAAIWYPYKAGPPEAVARWARASYAVFERLARDPATGVRMRSGVELLPEAVPAAWRSELRGLRPALASELSGRARCGWVYDAPVVEMPVYLEWLTRQVLARGVRIVQAEVRSLDELARECELVADCAGLGARELAGDPSMLGVRGQVVRVERNGVERFSLDDYDPAVITYVVPRTSDCILGGSAQEGREDLAPDAAEAQQIVERCRRLEPKLASATVLGTSIGVRPWRPEVRLEAEVRGRALVVHDYGHGGAGVTLSWGCAREVAQLSARALGRESKVEAQG
jgi:D-amino-acid oxidase